MRRFAAPCPPYAMPAPLRAGDVRYQAAAERFWRHLASPAGQASCWEGLVPAWWGVNNGR